MQIYGFDPALAPAGKGVIKVEMITPFAYWECASTEEYRNKKQQTADQVIKILEGYFAGISEQVEAVDVVTLKTWERFMGGTRGFANGPNKPFGIRSFLGLDDTTLPGLASFYMTGIWASGATALFSNALTGKTVIKGICKHDGKKFTTRSPHKKSTQEVHAQEVHNKK